MLGLFRVGPAICSQQCPDTVTISSIRKANAGFAVQGVVTVSPQTQKFANEVILQYGDSSQHVKVNPADGTWTFTATGSVPSTLTATSMNKGVAVYSSYQSHTTVFPASEVVKPRERRRFTRR
jgi:hypothetical protein